MSFSALSRMCCKVGLFARKHAPGLLTGAGVISIGYGTYRLIRDSRKLDPVLEEAKEAINDIHVKTATNEQYERSQKCRDLLKVYGNVAWKGGKVLAPGLLGIVGGTGLMLKAAGILNGRNKELMALCLQQAADINRFKSNLESQVGKEAAEKIYKGVTPTMVETVSLNDKGETVVSTSTEDVIDPDNLPPWTYPFTPTYFETAPETGGRLYAETLLIQGQRVLADKQRTRGWTYSSDVLDYFRFKGPDSRCVHELGTVYCSDIPLKDQTKPFTYEVIKTPISENGQTRYVDICYVTIGHSDMVLDAVFGKGAKK